MRSLSVCISSSYRSFALFFHPYSRPMLRRMLLYDTPHNPISPAKRSCLHFHLLQLPLNVFSVFWFFLFLSNLTIPFVFDHQPASHTFFSLTTFCSSLLHLLQHSFCCVSSCRCAFSSSTRPSHIPAQSPSFYCTLLLSFVPHFRHHYFIDACRSDPAKNAVEDYMGFADQCALGPSSILAVPAV